MKKKNQIMMDDIRSLEMMVDYAIVEGANLKLPLVVFLLRMVQMEITELKSSNIVPLDFNKLNCK